MNASKPERIDPDDASEWTEEMFAAAEYSVGGVVIRPATGVLVTGGIRPIGRPSLGALTRQPATRRLPPHVLDHFRSSLPGWQRRTADLLESHLATKANG